MQLKEGGAPDGLDALRSKPQLHGAVARSLCRGAAGRNYIIFTGPSITSLALFEEFEKQGRSGRSGVTPRPGPRAERFGHGSRSRPAVPGSSRHSCRVLRLDSSWLRR